MRSVLPDPEVEMLAARLQSAAFLRSSCTSATISFSGLDVHGEEEMLLWQSKRRRYVSTGIHTAAG